MNVSVRPDTPHRSVDTADSYVPIPADNGQRELTESLLTRSRLTVVQWFSTSLSTDLDSILECYRYWSIIKKFIDLDLGLSQDYIQNLYSDLEGSAVTSLSRI